MKENVKTTTKTLYTMCICLVVVMGVLFLGNVLSKGTYSVSTSNICPTGYTDNGTKCYKNMNGTFDKSMTNQSISYCSQGGTGTWSYCDQNMLDKTKYDCVGTCYVDYITNTSCNAGKYWSNSQKKCVTCSAGYYCKGGSEQPIICPIGYYCEGGTTSFKSCGSGKTTTTTGMDEESDCVVASCLTGQYFNDDEKKCEICPIGFYCPPGSLKKLSCDAGETTTASGMYEESDCVCKAGYYLSNSQNKCKICTAGYYCKGGSEQQIICPIGSYCEAGAKAPKSCSSGKTTTTTGMDEESDCIIPTYTITLMRAEGTETMSTCTTDEDGIIKSCTVTPSSICGSWSTTKYDKNNDTQTVAFTSSSLMTNKFTGDATLYCKAGTSGGGNTPTPDPTPSSSKPSSSSSKPSSSTPSSTPSSSSIDENPKTGSVAIFMVWVIAIGTLIYSIAYFKQSKFE